MNAWWWVPIGLAAWCLVGVVMALCIGRVLRRATQARESLDRRLMDKRVFPTINIEQSGTRKEELLIERDELQRLWLLRKALSQLNPVEGMELLVDKVRMTKTNKDFLNSMSTLG